jgi:hypothetical protein
MKTPAQIDQDLKVMTPAKRKTFEDRVRRSAQRQGFILAKSRARDPMSRTYDGYMLLREGGAGAEFGWDKTGGPGYEASLSMVAARVLYGWMGSGSNPMPIHQGTEGRTRGRFPS